MKTLGKFGKNIGTAVFTLAAVSSISMAAFAGEAKAVPMQKLVPSSAAAAVAASEKMNGVTAETKIEEGILPEASATTILTRTDKNTGKLEVSMDMGVTWSEFDGKAVMTTPAAPAKSK